MSLTVRICDRRVAGLLILGGLLASAGCDLSLFGTVTSAPVVTDLETAQELALAKAQEWDDTARLNSIVCVWVDENGALGDSEDNPGWAFQYVNGPGTLQIGVVVRPDGFVDASSPTALPVPIPVTLSAHTTQDIEDHIDAAQAELLKAPDGIKPATSTEDIAVIVGFNAEDGSEDATVLFHDDRDQATDWDEFNWFALFQNARAYVFLNTTDNAVETNSWEMSFERARRKARQEVAHDSRLVGILALSIDENGKLDEPADRPGWGFQFVDSTGTQQTGVTVEADGHIIVSAPTVLDSPMMNELSEYRTHDIEQYVTVALAELATAPAGKRPATDAMDLGVMIGFNAQTNAAEACVMFYNEAAQHTDWENVDWNRLAPAAEAYVVLDPETLGIQRSSW